MNSPIVKLKMAVTCVICSGIFRGRHLKIPCVCGCDRVAHLGCVPGLSKSAASLRKRGEALVFNCGHNSVDERDQNIAVSTYVPAAHEHVSCEHVLATTYVVVPRTDETTTAVPSSVLSDVPDPHMPMEFDYSYYNTSEPARSSVLFDESWRQSADFGNTLNFDELREIAPLASTRIESSSSDPWQKYDSPEEQTLDISEQPAVPESAVWKIVVEASKRDRVLLTDSMGFK